MEFKKIKEQRGEKRERGKPRNRLLTVENNLMVTRREVGGGVGKIDDRDEGAHFL